MENLLKELIDDFILCYEREKNAGRDIIMNDYILAPGTYILVDERDSTTKRLEVKKTQNRDTADDSELYDIFARYDYRSGLVDMNKPIDSKKIIQSNNCFSFFTKKESLINEKLNEVRIDEYYNFVGDLSKKYSGSSDKDKRKVLEEIKEKNGEVSLEKIEGMKKWIKENLFKLELEGKDYLKVFFNAGIEEYEKESEKYILPNIYNNNRYNIEISGESRGLPNNNMGMNDKKPYLENKTRKNKVPYLISSKEVMDQKLLFDYLMTQASNKKNYIYLNNEKIDSKSYDEIPNKFRGSFIKIKKGKELEIHDFDSVNIEEKTDTAIENVLDIDYSKIKDSALKSIYGGSNFKDLIAAFNQLYFFKGMWSCLINMDEYEIKGDKKLEALLKRLSIPIYDWLYKDSTIRLKKSFGKITLDIVKHTLDKGNDFRAMEMFNMRLGIIDHIRESENNMKDRFTDIRNNLVLKCQSKDDMVIEGVEEFSYAVGQLSYYLLSQNKGNKRKHSLFSPIVNAKRIKKVRFELENLFKKYNHEIGMNSLKFNNLYRMVLGFGVDKIDTEFLLGGYLANNIMYEKKEG